MDKDLNVVLDDLSHIKGFIGQLQGSILQIVKKTPTLQEFNHLLHLINTDDDSFQVAKIKELLNTNQTKLCIKIKQLYEQDELPFLKMLSLLNLKNKDEDNFEIINFVMDYHRTPQDFTGAFKELDDLSKGEVVSIDWDQSPVDLSGLLPELLPLKDDKLLKRVFINKSFIDPVLEVTNYDQYNELFNDKLILRGRSYLELILFDILEYKFPKIYYEDLNLIVQKLVDSNILFKLTIIYKLLDRFKYKLSNELDMSQKIAIIGDIFLSYIGGLSLEYSLSYLKVWVFKVYKVFLPSVDNTVIKFKSVEEVMFKQFQLLFEDYTFQELDTDPFVIRLIVQDIKTIGTHSASLEDAKKRAVTDFMRGKDLKTILQSQYQRQFVQNEIEQSSSEFQHLIQEKNIAVDHDIKAAGELFHVVISWNSVVLGVGVDKGKEMAVKKCEMSSFNNLRAMLGME